MRTYEVEKDPVTGARAGLGNFIWGTVIDDSLRIEVKSKK